MEPKWSNVARNTLIPAWNKAISRYYSDRKAYAPFTVIQGELGKIRPSQIQCDCMVSPANSYGIMDGGYALFFFSVLHITLTGCGYIGTTTFSLTS